MRSAGLISHVPSSSGATSLPPKSIARRHIGLSPVVWLYLITIIVPASLTMGPLLITALRGLMLVIIGPLLYGLFTGKYGRIYLVDGLFIFHIIWMGITLYVNTPEMMITQVGSLGIEFLGGYLIARAKIRTSEDFAALCRALVLIVCLTLPFAILETMTGRPLILEAISKLSGLRGVYINYQEPRLGLERVQLTFAHPIHYGLFCSVAFSFALIGLEKSYRLTLRIAAATIISLCGFLALSSGAFLAITLQMGLIAWSIIFARIRWRWWLLLSLAALAYITVDILSNRTPIMVALHYATFSAHTAYWRTLIFDWGMINVWENPIFGLGLEDWVRAWYMYSPTIDNFWLVLAVRHGIPGFMSIAIGYVLIIFYIMRRKFSHEHVLMYQRRAWVFTMIGLTFTLCTVHIWSNIYSFVFFIFGSGIWLIATEEDNVSDSAATPNGNAPKSRIAYTRFPHKTKKS